jgi:putative endonuclease
MGAPFLLVCHCEACRSKPWQSVSNYHCEENATWRGNHMQYSEGCYNNPVYDNLYCAYILASGNNTVIYTGVTSQLKQRVYQHKEHFVPGFTKRYTIDKLVYYEATKNILSALAREKQIKSWSRQKKNLLIESMNPEWRELHDEI